MTDRNLCLLLNRLLATGNEKPWLEFKQNCPDIQEIGTYISALANSALLNDKDRAFIVFGIEDISLNKLGTNFKPSQSKIGNEGFRNWLNRLLDPKLKFEFHEFECDGKPFSIIEIEPSFYKPIKFKGEAWVRFGEHKRKLSKHPDVERSLWLATGKRKFEDALALTNFKSTAIFQLLDIEPYYRLQGLQTPVSELLILENLVSANILYDELDSSYSITNLGAMLLARDISAFPSVRRKTVRVVPYQGNDFSNPRKEIEGQKGYAVGFEGLLEFVVRQTPQREEIINGVRRNTSIIPAIAIREFIANALIHQDLSATGGGPLIEIFSNRIEISNPGQPLGEINRLIDDVPRSRNEKLASAMRHLNLCEERGRGLDKSIAAIENSSTQNRINLPSPSLRTSTNGFVATLFGPLAFKAMTKEERRRACYQHCVVRFLKNEYMSNTSLRSRFSLADDEYKSISAVIADAIKENLVVPADAEQGNRNARYIPYFARTT